jgi:hypothetical protein
MGASRWVVTRPSTAYIVNELFAGIVIVIVVMVG